MYRTCVCVQDLLAAVMREIKRPHSLHFGVRLAHDVACILQDVAVVLIQKTWRQIQCTRRYRIQLSLIRLVQRSFRQHLKRNASTELHTRMVDAATLLQRAWRERMKWRKTALGVVHFMGVICGDLTRGEPSVDDMANNCGASAECAQIRQTVEQMAENVGILMDPNPDAASGKFQFIDRCSMGVANDDAVAFLCEVICSECDLTSKVLSMAIMHQYFWSVVESNGHNYDCM